MDRLHDYDINDTVLNQDITRIKKSIDLLEGSLKSIKKLEANANGMKGLTSQAILHRTDDLERTITRLIKRLEQQIKLLLPIKKVESLWLQETAEAQQTATTSQESF